MTEKDLALVKIWMFEYSTLQNQCCIGGMKKMEKLRFKLVSKIPELVSELEEAAGLRLELSAARAERDNNRALANGLEDERDRLREALRAKNLKSEI